VFRESDPGEVLDAGIPRRQSEGGRAHPPRPTSRRTDQHPRIRARRHVAVRRPLRSRSRDVPPAPVDHAEEWTDRQHGPRGEPGFELLQPQSSVPTSRRRPSLPRQTGSEGPVSTDTPARRPSGRRLATGEVARYQRSSGASPVSRVGRCSYSSQPAASTGMNPRRAGAPGSSSRRGEANCYTRGERRVMLHYRGERAGCPNIEIGQRVTWPTGRRSPATSSAPAGMSTRRMRSPCARRRFPSHVTGSEFPAGWRSARRRVKPSRASRRYRPIPGELSRHL
jgi:hypothetical protein